MELAMVDDKIVPLNEAKISVNDRGLYFGDGIYEVLYCYDGRFFALDAHIDRFTSSLRKMEMLEKVDLGQIRDRLERALSQARLPEALMYFHITRGGGPRSHDYDPDWQPVFLLTIRPFRPRGGQATAITHPDWRWKRCDIKSLNLLANVMAKHAAIKAGSYEAVLIDDNGLVTEATSSSVLIVKDGLLRTAPLTANILPGITRKYILECAGEIGLEVREESFTVADVLAADELIITGTGSAVMSITHLDGEPIADGKAGPCAKRLGELLQKLKE